jgi:hypothetical protein
LDENAIKPRPMGACSMRSHPIENSRFSKETRSRSYAKCCLLNVFAGRFTFSNAAIVRRKFTSVNKRSEKGQSQVFSNLNLSSVERIFCRLAKR